VQLNIKYSKKCTCFHFFSNIHFWKAESMRIKWNTLNQFILINWDKQNQVCDRSAWKSWDGQTTRGSNVGLIFTWRIDPKTASYDAQRNIFPNFLPLVDKFVISKKPTLSQIISVERYCFSSRFGKLTKKHLYWLKHVTKILRIDQFLIAWVQWERSNC
jgi:hypothetical protein